MPLIKKCNYISRWLICFEYSIINYLTLQPSISTTGLFELLDENSQSLSPRRRIALLYDLVCISYLKYVNIKLKNKGEIQESKFNFLFMQIPDFIHTIRWYLPCGTINTSIRNILVSLVAQKTKERHLNRTNRIICNLQV